MNTKNTNRDAHYVIEATKETFGGNCNCQQMDKLFEEQSRGLILEQHTSGETDKIDNGIDVQPSISFKLWMRMDCMGIHLPMKE